ncbi:Uncharacterised protein [Mycobacterium tuberculosis]|nr:Uncharacterised protein [Mycobacterium tuberculosis]
MIDGNALLSGLQFLQNLDTLTIVEFPRQRRLDIPATAFE